jgi:hypothetical protein
MKLYLAIPVLLLAACTASNNLPDKGKVTLDQNILSQCNTAIQNAIVVDRVSAPVGSRRYFYASVAAYESMVPFHTGYKSLAGQYHGLKACPSTDTSKDYCLDLVALAAHTFVSQKLVYKEDSIAHFRARKLAWYKARIGPNSFENSIKYGDSVGSHIVKWAKGDSFSYFRGREFYLVKKGLQNWQPTSPEFADAIEPNWGRIRTALAPSSDFISIVPPEAYSADKNSRFYKITKEVYDVVNKRDSADLKTALYWDDNPNSVVHIGHATINILKVSPAGHWLGMFSSVA